MFLIKLVILGLTEHIVFVNFRDVHLKRAKWTTLDHWCLQGEIWKKCWKNMRNKSNMLYVKLVSAREKTSKGYDRWTGRNYIWFLSCWVQGSSNAHQPRKTKGRVHHKNSRHFYDTNDLARNERFTGWKVEIFTLQNGNYKGELLWIFFFCTLCLTVKLLVNIPSVTEN